jgi:chaperone required for assembly of F1-ATPase
MTAFRLVNLLDDGTAVPLGRYIAQDANAAAEIAADEWDIPADRIAVAESFPA